MSRGRRDATGSDAFERSGTIRRCLLNDVRIVSRRIRVDRAPPRPRATHIRSHHRLKNHVADHEFPDNAGCLRCSLQGHEGVLRAPQGRPQGCRRHVRVHR